MRIPIAVALFLMVCMGYPLGTVAVAGGPVVNSDALGGFEFELTGNAEQASYLGTMSDARVSLAQIRADRLIIVIFNVFCAICQSDAAVLNSVHESIEVDPRLRGKTKLLGIATGNTNAEVEHFRQEHQVPFPLVADPEFALERAVSEKLRTPMLIIAKNVDGKSLQVVRTHLGGVTQAEDLLADSTASAASAGVHARALQH